MSLTSGATQTSMTGLPVETVGSTLTAAEWNALVAWAKAADAAGLISGDVSAVYATLAALATTNGNVSSNTSAIAANATAIATKQDHDADLDALAAISTTGFVERTGAGTAVARALLAADIPALTAAKISDFATAADARIAADTTKQSALGFTPENVANKNAAGGYAGLSSGKVAAGQLPVFVASGASHAAGVVPDPGASAGTTRFLREDATFAVPPAAGATTALDNLAAVAINASLLPATASTIDLGSTAKPYRAGYVTQSDAATNVITDALTLGHNSSGTPAASFGTGILFQGKSATVADRDMLRLAAIFTTATDASRATALVLQTVTAAGALTEVARFKNTGELNFPGATQKITGAFGGSVDLGSGTWVGAAGGAMTITAANSTPTQLTMNLQASAATADVNPADVIFNYAPSNVAGGVGGGTRLLFQAKTTTTFAQSQAAIVSAWTVATHASRTSEIQFWNVVNALAMAKCASLDMGAAAGDMGIVLWDFSSASLKRVSQDAVDTAGTGFRRLRVAN